MNAVLHDIQPNAGTLLPLTAAQIAAHLLEDFRPSNPALWSGTGIPAWIGSLFRTVNLLGHSNTYIGVGDPLQNLDPQWRTIVSQLIGIAATRRYLEHHGYHYVAHVSAFADPAPRNPLRVTMRPSGWPESTLTVVRAQPGLMPDYVAARPLGTGYALDLVESKGRAGCLDSLTTCPQKWSRQVENADMFLNSGPVLPGRRLVVATRVFLAARQNA